MRTRSAAGSDPGSRPGPTVEPVAGPVADLGRLHAAQHLPMVRLALLLTGDRSLAEGVVRTAFARLLRRRARFADPGTLVAQLRRLVVVGARGVRRPPGATAASATPGPEDAAERVLALPARQREVLVLLLWVRLTPTQTADAVRLREAGVDAAYADALRRLAGPDEGAPETATRVGEGLDRLAYSVRPADLVGGFGELVHEDGVRASRRRRGWALLAAAVLVAVAVPAVLLGVQRATSGPEPVPGPSPEATTATTAPTTPLTSLALAPGERPRADIPWDEVGPGWTLVTTATPATAVTTAVVLVAPDGRRFGVGSEADGVVLQDVTADGSHLLVAVGSDAREWDLRAGTSRSVPVPFGWKTARYAGPDPSYGYLVLWTDPTSTVRLERWTADGNLRTEYDTSLASTAGSPRHPGVLVSPDGATALLSSRDGPLQRLDLDTDAVTSIGPFAQAPSCEPLGQWSATQALVGCGSSVQVNAYDNLVGQPLVVTPPGGAPVVVAQAWSAGGRDVVQLDGSCSTTAAVVGTDRRVTPLPLGGPAAGLVPNTAVGDRLLLGGTRCPDDGDRLVAYDLRSGQATELVGPDAGVRTVRQALVLTAAR